MVNSHATCSPTGLAARSAVGAAFLLAVLTLSSARAWGQSERGTSTESLPGKDGGPELARAVFERFTKLEGSWLGRSTKGWEEAVTYRTIAAGSVVMSTCFDAHPNETMLTTYYLDGDRLMLTHYCVARNQPRLEATRVEEGGRRITFTFKDATNLSSRDKGHMDRVLFEFIDDDHFTEQAFQREALGPSKCVVSNP